MVHALDTSAARLTGDSDDEEGVCGSCVANIVGGVMTIATEQLGFEDSFGQDDALPNGQDWYINQWEGDHTFNWPGSPLQVTFRNPRVGVYAVNPDPDQWEIQIYAEKQLPGARTAYSCTLPVPAVGQDPSTRQMQCTSYQDATGDNFIANLNAGAYAQDATMDDATHRAYATALQADNGPSLNSTGYFAVLLPTINNLSPASTNNSELALANAVFNMSMDGL